MRDLTSRQIRDFVSRGDALNNQLANNAKRHARCNHLKGGFIGVEGEPLVPCKGTNENDYAVIKHQFGWGDVWVICLRCNKKWKPGMPDYQEALNFPTRNQMSTAIRFGKLVQPTTDARELTKES